jgi:hypothetical protein
MGKSNCTFTGSWQENGRIFLEAPRLDGHAPMRALALGSQLAREGVCDIARRAGKVVTIQHRARLRDAIGSALRGARSGRNAHGCPHLHVLPPLA